MKIVLIGRYNETEKLNGPEKYAKRLFSEVSAKYFDSTFIGYFFKGNQSSLIKRLFGKKIVSSQPLILKLGIARIFLHLLREQPNIIHIVTHERFIIPIFYYKFLLKGKIIVTHHSIVKEELENASVKAKRYAMFKDNLFERLSFKYADENIFVSRLLYERGIKNYSFNQKKAFIIPNGIDKLFYGTEKTIDVKKKLRILFYNGFNNVFHRGLNFIIDTLNQLIQIAYFELIVIGEDKTDKKSNPLFEISYKEQMSAKELSILMKETDLFFKTPEFDSFSFMVIEAMAGGMIVIVSSNVGAKDYIDHGINGFIYDKDCTNELNEILMKIFDNYYDLNSISKNALKVYDTLSWDIISRKCLELYN